MTYTVKQGQNLLDIAIQIYGDVSKVFDLARANGLDIGTSLVAGIEIEIDESKIVKPKIVKYFSDNQIIIATDGTDSQ